MRHGVHISADKRPEMARQALVIFDQSQSRIEASNEICDLFDVSTPTARNLVSYGRFLARAKG